MVGSRPTAVLIFWSSTAIMSCHHVLPLLVLVRHLDIWSVNVFIPFVTPENWIDYSIKDFTPNTLKWDRKLKYSEPLFWLTWLWQTRRRTQRLRLLIGQT